MVEPITFAEIAQIVASVVGGITIAGIIIKAAWTYIDLRWKVGSKDFITLDKLQTYCMQAQTRCPKIIGLSEMVANAKTEANRVSLEAKVEANKVSMDMRSEANRISENIRISTETLKEVVAEQKKLRQEVLPEKYVGMGLFKDTVERIEKALDKAVGNMKETAENIYNKIDGMKP